VLTNCYIFDDATQNVICNTQLFHIRLCVRVAQLTGMHHAPYTYFSQQLKAKRLLGAKAMCDSWLVIKWTILALLYAQLQYTAALKQSNCLLVCNNAPYGATDLSLLTTGICFVTRRRLLHKVAASGNYSTNSTYRTLDHASYPARFPQYLDSKYACLCCNIQPVCKNHSNFDVPSLWRG